MASLCDNVYMIKWTSNINTLIQAHVSSSNKEPPGWCNSPSTPYYQLDQNCIILPGKTGKHSCSRLGVYNWQLIKDNWHCSVCIQVCVWGGGIGNKMSRLQTSHSIVASHAAVAIDSRSSLLQRMSAIVEGPIALFQRLACTNALSTPVVLYHRLPVTNYWFA